MKGQYDASKYENYIVKAFLVFMTIIFMLLFYSCSPYYYKSKGPEVTHVLALTKEGDTLKIPIKDIRPNVIYNVVGYDWYRPYSGYYTRWAEPYYHPNLYKSKPIYNKNNNNYNNNNNTNITPPRELRSGDIKVNSGNPAVNNPRKNN